MKLSKVKPIGQMVDLRGVMNIDNLSGLDKAAILFQVLGESLALSMFQNISEAEMLRIRVRSRELSNIPTSVKHIILEEYYFKMMSTQYHNLDKDDNKLFSFLNDNSINLTSSQIKKNCQDNLTDGLIIIDSKENIPKINYFNK